MTRDDLLKLLGGYATGTLTADERNLLFAAALDDQELFDALADEQALKEMLEDPECRARLLAATAAESGRRRVVPMPVPAPKKARPRWLVPLGIAASVIVIASVAAIYLHRPAPMEMAGVRTPERLDAPTPAPVIAQSPVLAPPPVKEKELRRREADAKVAERPSQPVDAPQQTAKSEELEKKATAAPAAELSATARGGAAGAGVTAGTLGGAVGGSVGGVVGGVPGALSNSINLPVPEAPAPAPFTQTAASPDRQTILRYTVLRRTADGEYLPVDPKTEFTSGDEIRLRLGANQTGSIQVSEPGTILFASSITSAATITTSTLPVDAGKPLEISFARVLPRAAMSFSAAKQKTGAMQDEVSRAKDQVMPASTPALRITLPLRIKTQ